MVDIPVIYFVPTVPICCRAYNTILFISPSSCIHRYYSLFLFLLDYKKLFFYIIIALFFFTILFSCSFSLSLSFLRFHSLPCSAFTSDSFLHVDLLLTFILFLHLPSYSSSSTASRQPFSFLFCLLILFCIVLLSLC